MASCPGYRRDAAGAGSAAYTWFDFLEHDASGRQGRILDLGYSCRSTEELMRDLAELNINEGGRPVNRPAPTDDVISSFETRYGVVLPKEYLRLLRYSNGGHPELDSIEPVGRPGAARWAVNRFYHLDGDTASTAGLWSAMERWRPELGKNAIPIAEDGGGNQFFLDLTTSPPAMKVCVHDEGFAIVDIAPSLEAFIDALATDPDMI